jgi:hypothetical protein
MRTPAAAIAWEFRQRHRWGLTALTAYMLVLAMVKLLILRQPVEFANGETFGLIVMFPLTTTVIYFLAIFTFGLSGDLAGRQSMYPARMFTLPVSTAALAGWPMLYGTAAMVVLWLATRLLGIWPAGESVPILWPALLAASLLAWTQALTWMPYALPGLRIVVTMLWLATIDSVVLLALEFKTSEPVMLAILAPHVPLAFLAARSALRRARGGDVPDWRGMFARGGQIANVRTHFSSAARAQTWFEWRLYGRSLPALVAILLPFELGLLFLFSETPAIVFETLLAILLTPPFMAIFVSATASKASFMTTRPMSNASLVTSKLKAAMWSTLAAWLPVLVAIPIALRLSGTSRMVLEWVHQVVNALGMPRAAALLLLGLFALMASTWKQLVQSLYIGMTGREWIVKASVFAALSFLAIVLPLAHWIAGERYRMGVLWESLPLLFAVLVLLKLAAAVWIALRLHHRNLLSDRRIVITAVGWDLLVFALYGAFVWITPALLVRRYVLALIAILLIPLVRVSAAPLALAWNRNR